ncbi:hypothetical protein GJ744_001702 [Endocarpon pusillum]|uniref:Uncharacterized protein n=1 Tax=Endocarpon pusillum TaxID=364733 RepID=A0A8H7E356_9EURO|nr:hypothetical protein GJ744_001702 [Endocarpon pusillum]
MGLSHQPNTSARRARMIDLEKFNYITWVLTNQHLFATNPITYMPYGISINITVQANGINGGGIHIPNVPCEPSLTHSLITPQFAQASGGTVVRTGAVFSFQDTDGNVYRSSSYIALTWWQEATAICKEEDFYITEDIPADAMLQQLPDVAQDRPKAFPLQHKLLTPEEQRRADDKRKQAEAAHNVIRQAENQKVENDAKKSVSSRSKQRSNYYQ